ncbi:hypothetical protein KBB60_02285 [Patescibacteria group bacterium]|nr:hypothetical protein [Patescibacteria group bacterium]
MAKFRKHELSKKETEDLLLDFAAVLSNIKQPKEAVQLIRDLMSEQEARMFAKRLKIADLLLSGKNYFEISQNLKVSSSTIARVNAWLQASGEGYRLMIKRLKTRRSDKQYHPGVYDFSSIRRRYPAYYWPQALLEAVASSASNRQKQQIIRAMEKMREKDDLFQRLETILKHKS